MPISLCLKCHRVHSGICGIPAGVVLRFGARVGNIRQSRSSPSPAQGKPKVKKPGTTVLKEMLLQAHIQEKKVFDLLKVLPFELPEYTELMDRASKLEQLIDQLNRQLIERESR